MLPAKQYHHQNTIAAMPLSSHNMPQLQRHHSNKATAKSLPKQYQHKNTTAAMLVLQHYHHNTVTTVLLPQHGPAEAMTQWERHSNTTMAKRIPPLQCHDCNTFGKMLPCFNTTVFVMPPLQQQNGFNVTPAAPPPTYKIPQQRQVMCELKNVSSVLNK